MKSHLFSEIAKKHIYLEMHEVSKDFKIQQLTPFPNRPRKEILSDLERHVLSATTDLKIKTSDTGDWLSYIEIEPFHEFDEYKKLMKIGITFRDEIAYNIMTGEVTNFMKFYYNLLIRYYQKYIDKKVKLTQLKYEKVKPALINYLSSKKEWLKAMNKAKQQQSFKNYTNDEILNHLFLFLCRMGYIGMLKEIHFECVILTNPYVLNGTIEVYETDDYGDKEEGIDYMLHHTAENRWATLGVTNKKPNHKTRKRCGILIQGHKDVFCDELGKQGSGIHVKKPRLIDNEIHKYFGLNEVASTS